MKKRTLQLQFSIIYFLSFVACLFLSTIVNATTYYVATTGNDSYAGTSISVPFLTLKYAVGKVVAGDTIYMRAGNYVTSTNISISKAGNSTSKYYLFVYPGDERPVLDFSSMAIGGSNRGISLSGSYWYIKGIRIKGAGDNGMNISGAYNTLEFCDFYENRDGGCQLGGGAHDNRIINCDSYLNADYVSGSTTYTGGNADGFSPKLDVGTNNYFYGCRAWLNSDDGWDGYLRPADGVTTTLENCWTWKNGYLKDGVTTTSSMNGNGFKLGGSDTKDLRHNFIVKNCLSFNNKANGFDQNSNVGSITIYNGTSVNNGGKNFYLNSNVTMPAGSIFTVENCVAVGSTGTAFRSGTVLSNNQFSATATNFITIDTTGVTAPRKADGSLPDISFVHLIPGSALVDAGIDVGLPYNGTNPDLGCFETSTVQYTLTTSVASGNGSMTPASGTHYYSGSLVPLKAIPAANYTFVNWGGDISGTSATYSVMMSADKNVTASFALVKRTLTLAILPVSSGTIAPTSGLTYDHGSNIKLTGTPATGYVFDKWTISGSTFSTYDTVTITMDADKTITGNFKLNTGVGIINTTDDSFAVWYGGTNEIKLVFDFDNDAKVAIYLYNAQGTLVSYTPALSYCHGNHAVDLTNKSLVAGVYLCKLLVNGKGITRKVVVY